MVATIGKPATMDANALTSRIFGPNPFARLAYTHALSASGDAFFAVSLAGSLFFNVSVDAARPRIILYLALTMAPFAIVTPLIGPLVDRLRGARHGFIALTMLVRGILCLFVAGDLRSLFFYPEAFAVLVVGKGYAVARSAAIPGLVGDPGGLVAANSRISRISSLAGTIGGGAAAGILALGDAPLVLRLASLVYFAAAVVALRIPPSTEGAEPPREVEQAEVHSRSIVLGASALSILRASIGFLTFLIAFAFRRADEPVWLYGAVLLAVAAGNFAATIISPALKRRWLTEEQLFASALALAGIAAFVCAARFSRPSVLVAGAALGLAANVGRQAFDSVLQRDAPDAARGRWVARFETRFQLAWVIGALVPVVLRLGTRAGLVVLGVTFAIALAAYVGGTSIEAGLTKPLRDLLARRRRARSPG
ncbi:MAG TPA: MFS transporter [Acidimicrobiia bacterium]